MTTILSHQEDLGTIMLDVKYEGLGGTCLVTIPLNMAPNLSECNVSHGGIALEPCANRSDQSCPTFSYICLSGPSFTIVFLKMS